MKILYLCPDLGIPVLGRKGASVHVRELTNALNRAGHRVTLAAQSLTKSASEIPAKIGARVIQIPLDPSAANAVQSLKEFNERLNLENSLPSELRRILYNTPLYQELKLRFLNHRPDFIYERASLYATAGARLAAKFKVPHLVELNAPLALEQSAYRATGLGELAAQAERSTLTHADAVVVVSFELRRHVLSLGVKPAKIHVMPNGVNAELFHPAEQDSSLRRELKLGENPVIGFVGGLRPWHGVEILPELLQRLSLRYTTLQLIIVGDGPLRETLEREFKKRGLAQRVVFTGALSHEEVPAVIRQFDLALAPYPKHNHDFYFSPMKLFEYMACGVPVVAADVGQISEIIRNGANGMLYPAGNLNALVKCCEKLLTNPILGKTVGRAGAKLMHAKFTWDINAARVIKIATHLKRTRRNSIA
ncbi:MAG: glycosyltransferase family 4 protein [Verrucomicrobiota bacterium]